uniref:acetyl-coenzyme A synthetase N-terminal domain-containing protein n=1 Tax=Escherichia coli TaxID=562 RepID=UPI002989B56B
MSQIHKHTIPANIADRCLINPQQYEAMYQQSINVPDTFWGEQGKILDWIKPYQKVKNTSFAPGNVNRPGFPGECFICELRLPDHRFRWKH